MQKTMLKRDKALSKMTIVELGRWLNKLCECWDFEYAQWSTGLPNIEEEIKRTCKALIQQCGGEHEKDKIDPS